MTKKFTNFIVEYYFNVVLLINENLKKRFIEKIGKMCNYKFIDIFIYFLNNQHPDKLSSMIMLKEKNYLIGLLTIYYSR